MGNAPMRQQVISSRQPWGSDNIYIRQALCYSAQYQRFFTQLPTGGYLAYAGP